IMQSAARLQFGNPRVAHPESATCRPLTRGFEIPRNMLRLPAVHIAIGQRDHDATPAETACAEHRVFHHAHGVIDRYAHTPQTTLRTIDQEPSHERAPVSSACSSSSASINSPIAIADARAKTGAGRVSHAFCKR